METGEERMKFDYCKDHQGIFATPQTCFSAGDMADAAAKAFQEGAESNRAATDELLAALKSMFNEYGEFDYTISMLNNARAAIAKHEPKP